MQDLNIVLGVIIIALNLSTIMININDDTYYGFFKPKHYIVPILLLTVGVLFVAQGFSALM